ncbi:TIGR04002 family protein [Caproicibacter fermentans]|uniref:TIGR04002 family protein n=1 Tax=Caproicibacter fermentans TaxID=2576756 RepID=A0A7G8T9T2_9FIRM|nr:TIGR04002 family protein [Caproicibacter fermentans]QNK40373.1 TIGR04002 family protein [Caproicibacter fermentans]
MKKTASTGLIVFTALFAALIFVVTAYLFHIPTPVTGGYIHLGDAFLYLAASILPLPYAVAAGGIGEALSDGLTGSAVYVLPTLLIKSAMVLCFASAAKSIVTKRNLIACAAAGGICVAGYYLTEVVLLGSFAAPVAEIPGNLIQAAASAVIYILVGRAFDRMKLKSRLAVMVKQH